MQSRLVSAILLGTNIPVPKGKDVGGAFKKIPLCRTAGADGLPDHLRVVPLDAAAAGQYACLAASTATAWSRRAPIPRRSAAAAAICTRTSPAPGSLIASGAPAEASVGHQAAPRSTRRLSACRVCSAQSARRNENGTYLELTVNGDPADPRADDIPGDLGMIGRVQANWGMHLVDVNLTMGNLVDIVGKQVEGVLAKK